MILYRITIFNRYEKSKQYKFFLDLDEASEYQPENEDWELESIEELAIEKYNILCKAFWNKNFWEKCY